LQTREDEDGDRDRVKMFSPAVVIRPLARAELICAVILVSALAIAIVWCFLLHVSLSATMLEYVFKFLPGLTDGGLAATLDFNALGDPRPRPLTTLLTYANVVLRRELFSFGPIHPSLGINWILYPICIFLAHRVVFRLTTDRRAALIAVILFAASPAMLDTLTNYYIPGKPLAMVMMLLAIYGACIVFPAPAALNTPRPLVGSVLIFAAGLLGLLSDETAVFIFACVPVVFADRVFDRDVPVRIKIMFLGSLAASLLAFAVLAVFLVPLLNVALGQSSVDLYTVIVRGVYESMFWAESKPVETLISDGSAGFWATSKSIGALLWNMSPGSLLETILSVHTVPHRLVERTWTSGDALPHFYAWRLSDQIGLYVFITISLIVMACMRGDKNRWYLSLRLALASLVFILIESVLILRLSPWIVETNYYAAFSSLFFALVVSNSVSGIANRHSRGAIWGLVAYFTAVQFLNYYETAQRHPSINGPKLSWSQLRDTYRDVQRGNFASVAANHPFPSQLFSYGFEQAVALDHAAGRRVDLLPMKDPESSIIRFIPFTSMVDPRVPALNMFEGNESSLLREDEKETDIFLPDLRGKTIGGVSGQWQFVRHFTLTGEIRERAWRRGLLRLWSRRGNYETNTNGFCLRFPNSASQCIAHVYGHSGLMYGFAQDGTWVMTFAMFSEKFPLPLDLRK
jgi:hypothetical protein